MTMDPIALFVEDECTRSLPGHKGLAEWWDQQFPGTDHARYRKIAQASNLFKDHGNGFAWYALVNNQTIEIREGCNRDEVYPATPEMDAVIRKEWKTEDLITYELCDRWTKASQYMSVLIVGNLKKGLTDPTPEEQEQAKQIYLQQVKTFRERFNQLVKDTNEQLGIPKPEPVTWLDIEAGPPMSLDHLTNHL